MVKGVFREIPASRFPALIRRSIPQRGMPKDCDLPSSNCTCGRLDAVATRNCQMDKSEFQCRKGGVSGQEPICFRRSGEWLLERKKDQLSALNLAEAPQENRRWSHETVESHVISMGRR